MAKETLVDPDGDSVQTVHFYLLDILRGLAALAVVLWHYQHFFFKGTSPAFLENFDRSLQPFYGALWLFYNEGSRAVQLFFVLSGFIFFSQYLDDIQSRRVDGRNFLLLRLTRLYPLYFLTLVVVAIGQWTSLSIDGNYIVYPCNSVWRLIPSLMFVSEWLPQKYVCSVAFNGPAWSLSVEAFLYLAFFVFARFLSPRGRLALFIATLGMIGVGVLFYTGDGYRLMGEPICCFFAGGAVYFMWDRLRTGRRLFGVAVALGMALVAVIASLLYGTNPIVLGSLAYPSIVLLLAIVQTGEQGQRLQLVGDISYSVYLLHFPIQLIIILSLKLFGFNLDFYSPIVWTAFFSLLIVTSVLAYKYFERPMQRSLRRILLGNSPQHGRKSAVAPRGDARAI